MPKKTPNPYQSAGRASAIGIELAVSFLIFFLSGYWADRRFETSPFLTLAGILVGSYAAFRVVWRTVNELKAENEESDS